MYFVVSLFIIEEDSHRGVDSEFDLALIAELLRNGNCVVYRFKKKIDLNYEPLRFSCLVILKCLVLTLQLCTVNRVDSRDNY